MENSTYTGNFWASICIYSEKYGTQFLVDPIFAFGSFWRYNFPGGYLKDLHFSMERLIHQEVQNLCIGHNIIIEGEGKKHIEIDVQNILCLRY